MSQINDNDALVSVKFRMNPTYNSKESDAQKRPIYDDMEVCEIRTAANKQTVGVFPAHEMAEWSVDEHGQKVPLTYAMKYNAQYMAFKNGEAQTQSGTPLEAADFLTVGKRLELKALNIHTIDALAAIDGAALKRLGMGGREWKDKAIAYLSVAHEPVSGAHLASVISEQDKKIAELTAQLEALQPASSSEPAAETEIDPVDADAETSEFRDFEDDDIRNWLHDAAPALAIDGRWSRKTLLAKADEVNAALKAKNGKAA